MPIRIRFMALSGEFKTVREEIFRDVTAAMPAILAHAKSGNYTNVKRVEDVDSLRFTARTPGGRGGRNIAFGDWDDNLAPKPDDTQRAAQVARRIEFALANSVPLDDGNVIDYLADSMTRASLPELRVALSRTIYASRFPKACTPR